MPLILYVSLLFHLLAAWFSHGFYDMDEQFQVLEFTNVLLGRSSAEHLPWEFAAQIRPWFQPTLYEGVLRVAQFIGVESPFEWARILRVFTGVLGWSAFVALAMASRRQFKAERNWHLAVTLGSLLWCLPYLSVRTSSESMSTAFCVLGLASLLHLDQVNPNKEVSQGSREGLILSLIGGLFLGLAFECRFQIGFMVAGVLAWVMVFTRRSWRNVLWALFGILIVVGVCALVDRRGYQSWAFPPWNYFYQNLVEGRAASFGVEPPIYYFREFFQMHPPLGALMVLTFVLGWLFAPLSPWTWATVPFFWIHQGLAHKEPRFLFPMAVFAPFVLIQALEGLVRFTERFPRARSVATVRLSLSRRPSARLLVRITLTGLALVNFALLLGSVLKPSSAHPLFYRAVAQATPRVEDLFTVGGDPYRVGGSSVHFYRVEGFPRVQKVGSFDEVVKQLEVKPKRSFWLFYDQFELPEAPPGLRNACRLTATTFPDFLRPVLFIPGLRIASKWSLFLCSAGSTLPI